MPNPGKRGLVPHDPARFVPRLEDYRTGGPLKVAGLPPANGNIDRSTQITDWGMQNNDQWGCCVEAMAIHASMALNTYAGHPVTYDPNYGQKLYSEVTGFNPNAGPPGQNSTDNGTEIQVMLEYWKNTGLTDTSGNVHKIAGYAQFGNPADEVLLAQVLDTFGCVLVGVSLQQSQESQFSAGEPWEYMFGEQFIGGHGITLQQRSVGGVGTLHYITWGTAQPATRRFQYFCAGQSAGEAWAVVSQDWLESNGDSIEGLNIDQLLSDLQYVSSGLSVLRG